MTAIERLEQDLNAKDKELEAMSEQLENMQAFAKWEWSRHSTVENDPLPTPRLEMEALDDSGNWYVTNFIYSLVYRHFLGHSVKVPIGHTRRSGGRQAPAPDDLPFREGAHFMHDKDAFGWPAYIRIESRIWIYKGRGENREILVEEIPCA